MCECACVCICVWQFVHNKNLGQASFGGSSGRFEKNAGGSVTLLAVNFLCLFRFLSLLHSFSLSLTLLLIHCSSFLCNPPPPHLCFHSSHPALGKTEEGGIWCWWWLCEGLHNHNGRQAGSPPTCLSTRQPHYTTTSSSCFSTGPLNHPCTADMRPSQPGPQSALRETEGGRETEKEKKRKRGGGAFVKL